ncbi:hypothetical protein HDV00_011427 [Rhizophlyctis rosea]|nr:hypothetical protein HDV00_011427 [Rhizophlyctis rosea]
MGDKFAKDDGDADEGPDAPGLDDERPQFEVDKGITYFEVETFLGKNYDGSTTKRKAESGPDEKGSTDGKVVFGTSKSKSKVYKSEGANAEKKRKTEEKRKEALANTKKIKNKTLLSFDDEP